MNIVFDEQAKELQHRFTLLQLDTFRDPDTQRLITAYCVVNNIPLAEMSDLDHQCQCHADLIQNYQQAKWSQCCENLAQLRGRWNGELDSFYHHLAGRIEQQQKLGSTDQWDWTLPKHWATSG